MPTSELQLKRLYNKFNDLYWAGELPNDISLIYEPVAAFADCQRLEDGTFVIRINPAISHYADFVKLTLLHEMCHVKLWDKTTRHGTTFDVEIQRLMSYKSIRKLI
jgi:hypothetical protein